MKQKSKQNRLSIGVIVLGCCALVLRRLLYGVAVDVKNLLPVNHPLEIALWVLSAGANLWIVASVWKLDGSAKYEDNFQPSLTAAVDARDREFRVRAELFRGITLLRRGFC